MTHCYTVTPGEPVPEQRIAGKGQKAGEQFTGSRPRSSCPGYTTPPALLLRLKHATHEQENLSVYCLWYNKRRNVDDTSLWVAEQEREQYCTVLPAVCNEQKGRPATLLVGHALNASPSAVKARGSPGWRGSA